MIRLAHTSDLHIDERGRVQDVHDALDAFLQGASERNVDLIILAGDFFERRSTPSERLVLADFLEAASAIAPVFGVKGNHDAAFDLDVFPRLNVEHPVWILDRPTIPGGPEIRVKARNGRELALLALPWFDKAHLVIGLPLWQDQEDDRRQTIATAQALMAAIGSEATRARREGAIPILASHAMVAGSEVATGQTLMGITVEIPPHDFYDLGCAYVALGHIHKHQSWHNGQVAYSGSPHRCNFGEPEEKGWCFVTLDDDGHFVKNEFVLLPVRPMVLIEGWLNAEALAQPGAYVAMGFGADGWLAGRSKVAGGTSTRSGPPDIRGAIVRFRYHIRAQDLHVVNEAAIRRILEADGAHEVKLEAVIETETRARVPEIVQVQSLSAKVLAYLQAKGIELAPVDIERVLLKAAVLDKETRA